MNEERKIEETGPILGKKYKSAEVEAKWRRRWEEWDVHRYDTERPRRETFAVDTPPPTVSGSLHIGHAFSYTHQDLLVRFHRMRGKNIFYPMGWDDNGLPTERRVENIFNIRCDPSLTFDSSLQLRPGSSGRPLQVSRANFIEACNRTTTEDEEVYKDMWQRLGLSVDWSMEYATISNDSRRVSQYSFLQLMKAGEIYTAEVPMAWDTKFQTAIAQAEMEDREIKGNFYRIQFRIAECGEFQIATTRPELLAACVAVIVHPDDKRYEALVGKQAITPVFHAPVPILKDSRAQMDKGTGVVMVCTFGDKTDVEWWRDHKLPVREIISENGRILAVPFGEENWPSEKPDAAVAAIQSLQGLPVEQARKKMVELLIEANALVGDPEPIKHDVKFYEKGSKPLEIITTRQWFIRLLDKKEALIEQGKKIEWYPAFMFGRYKNWVEGLNQDWCISRQRYFGVPFPIWYKLDAEGNPIRGKPILAREDQLPVDPLSDTPGEYTPDQRNKPHGFSGETDVLDTWATSSLTPQLASEWPLHKSRHAALYPMDVRPQSHEIIRTWAFYTIAMSYMHESSVPWNHIVISGWVLDPDRKKMSKSKGNVVTPVDLLDKYSADGVRYWAARARAGVDTAYDESVFQVGRKLVTKLFHASRFVLGILQGSCPDELSSKSITTEIDRALIHRLREVVQATTDAYERFDWAIALSETESFFWSEFCDDYVELIKNRAYRDHFDSEKQSAHATLRIALSVLLRLFAPTLPFVTEEIWNCCFANGVGSDRSIHKSNWPSSEELDDVDKPIDPKALETTYAIIHEIRRVKGREGKYMGWPVERLIIHVPNAHRQTLLATREDIISVGAITDFQLQEANELSVDVVLASEDST